MAGRICSGAVGNPVAQNRKEDLTGIVSLGVILQRFVLL